MPIVCRFRPARRRWPVVAFALVGGLATPFKVLATPPEAAVLTPQRAVAIALEGNPGLAQIRARAEAMAAIPAQEGALPDPVLNVGLLNLPTRHFDLRREDMTMLEVGISQLVPFPGKLALREQAATLEAEAAVHTVEEARLQLARDVVSRWWQLLALERTLRIIADSERLLQQLAAIADTKYRVGEGSSRMSWQPAWNWRNWPSSGLSTWVCTTPRSPG